MDLKTNFGRIVIMEIKYSKLVRDKIPEIIEKNNKHCEFIILDSEEYFNHLNKKLLEEVNEYLESKDIEEIADILEVIYSILKHKNIDKEEIEKIRVKKKNERGSFDKRIMLKRVWV
jgi:predicted house-cleaning noncanonical NTP pyrophosphatase (MazG superfamily)